MEVLYKKEDFCILAPNKNIVLELKRNIIGTEIMDFKTSKGHEWFAGIVLIDAKTLQTFEEEKAIDLEAINSFYVAITRFREKVIILSVEGSNRRFTIE